MAYGAGPNPWVSIRDAHTHAEECLYQTMFRFGTTTEEQPHVRHLTIGMRSLARLVPMAYSTCQRNVQSLIQKLTIEDLPAEHQDGRRFVVYGEEEVLKRRREAGLTHVARRTHSVILLKPSESSPIDKGVVPEEKQQTTLATNARIKGAVIAKLEALGFSDDAVGGMVEECLANAPDATEEEIVFFLKEQAYLFFQNSRIHRLAKFFVLRVPKCFTPDSLARHRQNQKRLQEEADRRDIAFLSDMLRIIEDPNSNPEHVAVAKGCLGLDRSKA